MTVVKTYCDHCGAELDDMRDYFSVDIEIGYVEINADLCNQCVKELTEAVKTFCTEEADTDE